MSGATDCASFIIPPWSSSCFLYRFLLALVRRSGRERFLKCPSRCRVAGPRCGRADSPETRKSLLIPASSWPTFCCNNSSLVKPNLQIKCTPSVIEQRSPIYFLSMNDTQILGISEQNTSAVYSTNHRKTPGSFPMNGIKLNEPSHAISTLPSNPEVCMTLCLYPPKAGPTLTATKCLTSVHSSPQRISLSIVPPSSPSPFPVVS